MSPALTNTPQVNGELKPVPELAPRPTWRGRTHAWTFLASIPAGILLVLAARNTSTRISALIYVVGLLCVFGTSAAYHRLAHSYRARTIMRRLDHTMIYVLIATTYVPIYIIALPPAWGIPTLSIVGVLGVFGILLNLMAPNRLPKVGVALYLIMGWMAVVAGGALIDSLTTTQLVLIVAGGVTYTAGFPVFLAHWPDPWPKTFGYHEIWHLFTIVAAVLHFTAITTLVV